MTSGTYSQQLNAISTARNHMSTFRDMADALDNGTIPVLNKAGNAWVQAFGGEAPTNFAVAKEAFAGEVGRALAGAGVTLADRQEAGNNISAANSPKQLHGVIDTVDKLLKGKQDAIKQTFQSGMKGQPNFGQDQSSTIYARDPQGHLHAAPAGTALPAGWKQESH
jgi:catechol 2,3-dioxygenase-like lactoylglutathione lyase family enzyme